MKIIIKYAILADHHELCPYTVLFKILSWGISAKELTFFRNAFVL